MPVETDTSYTADHTQTQFEGYLNDARAAAGQAAANNTSTHNGQELLFSRNGGSNPGASLDFGAGSSWWLPRMINRLRARGEVAKLIDAQFGGHTIITTRRYIFASETLGDRIMRECASDSKSKFSFNKIDEKALKEIADRIDAVHREFRKGNGDAFKVYRSFFWRDDPSKFNITPKSLKVLFNPANKAGGVARNRTFGADKRKKSAKERQVYANYQLGCAYRDGAGVQKNGLSALYYFNKAAEGGHSKAQYELAQLYLQGADGVKKNNTEAAYWLLRAAKGGNKAAQEELERIKTGTDTALKLALAKTCQAGMSGFERDVGMAAEFLLLARDEGSAKAAVQMETIKHGDDAAMQTAVGNCLKKSRRPGDFRDVLDEATAYFEPAAKAGYAEAQYEYAMRYADMSWGDHDLNEAAFWLVRAQANESIQAKLELEKIVKEGPPAFQFALAELYRNGREEINSNVEKAKSLYRRLAIAGHAEARYQYAMCLKRADRDGSKRHEVAQWLVAAEQKCDAAHKEVESIKESGDRAFLHALALSYYRGDLGSPPNFEKAAILYEQLAEADDAHGQFMYAEHLRRGLGVDEDLNKAVYWMVMASRNGSKQAQDQLNTLTRAKRSDLHWSLYELYRAGNGEIKKDISKAAYWLAIAQQKGGASAEAVVSKITEHDDPALQLALAQVYRTGKDSTGKYRATKDLNKAAYWLAMARQCGNASAEAVVSKITEHDDPALQLALAQVYRTGKDSTGKYRATKDYDLAAKLFEKLAQDDNAEAQYRYAMCLMAGRGVKEDLNKAVYWLALASQNSSENAQEALRKIANSKKEVLHWPLYNIYAAGHNALEQDMSRAAYWLAMARQCGNVHAEDEISKIIEHGDSALQLALAQVYSTGEGKVQQNPKWAALLYEKAAQANDMEAQYQYATCLKDGVGVDCDFNEAAYWLIRAVDAGSNTALKELESIIDGDDLALQFALAELYRKGRDDVKPDVEQAAGLYYKLAEAGHSQAPKIQHAMRHAVHTAQSPEFCLTMSERFRTGGNGFSVDFDKAAYWLLEAAKHKDGAAAREQIEDLKQDNADPRFQFAMGKRSVLNGEHDFGKDLIEKAAKQCLEKGDANLTLNIGRYYSGIGDNKTAAVYFREASKQSRDDPAFLSDRADLDGAGVKLAQSPAFSLAMSKNYQTGKKKGFPVDFDKAAYWLLEAAKHKDGAALEQIEDVKQDNADPRFQFAVGKRYLSNGQGEMGGALIERAAKQVENQGDPSLQLSIARHYFENEKKDQAKTYLDKAADQCVEKGDANLTFNIGKLYKSIGLNRDADACFAIASQQCVEKGDVNLTFNIGKLYKSIGLDQDADACFAIASQQWDDDTDTDLQFEIGEYYLNIGKLDMAQPHLERAALLGKREADDLLSDMKQAMNNE